MRELPLPEKEYLPTWLHQVDVNELQQRQVLEFPDWDEDTMEVQGGLMFSTQEPYPGAGNHRRLMLPTEYRQRAFQQAHQEVAHAGFRKTIDTIRETVVWPGLRRYVQEQLSVCPTCAHFTKKRKGVGRPGRLSVPEEPLTVWGLDVIGPLPETENGMRYGLTMVDHFTRWVEVIPMPDKTNDSVWRAVERHLVARYGPPVYIITDNGGEFTAKEFEKWLEDQGIRHQVTSPYNPAANGTTERANGTIKRMLSKLCLKDKTDWAEKLPKALWAYNHSVHSTLQQTPYYLMFGQRPRRLLEIPNKKLKSEKSKEWQKARREAYQQLEKQADLTFRRRQAQARPGPVYQEGDLVLVKNHVKTALEPDWLGGYHVTHVGDHYVTVTDGRRDKRVNLAHVKPAPYIAHYEAAKLAARPFVHSQVVADASDSQQGSGQATQTRAEEVVTQVGNTVETSIETQVGNTVVEIPKEETQVGHTVDTLKQVAVKGATTVENLKRIGFKRAALPGTREGLRKSYMPAAALVEELKWRNY
jgi:transposase InsO family protein